MARTRCIQARVTPEEEDRIDRDAHDAGMTMSDWVRFKLGVKVVDDTLPEKRK